jgi:3'-phosphoadenosine 5'-phosphosulfate sulfotransferase (PAPS reductase)/FAD synthetase
MVHQMLERGEQIHSLLFFDTGWEFPEMYAHLELHEQKTGLKINRIKSKKSFDHWMYRQRVVAKSGLMKGEVVHIGYGWPHPSRRWCTREKVQALAIRYNAIPDLVSCVGYAADETHRCKDGIRYPLIEYGMTEADCLQFCQDLGYSWGGLYEIFSRVSCWCCPLQPLPSLRKLRKHKPELWQQLLEMDLKQPKVNQGFKDYHSVIDLETRFRCEEQKFQMMRKRKKSNQLSLFNFSQQQGESFRACSAG